MGFTIAISVKDVPAERVNDLLEQLADVLDEEVATEREITLTQEDKWTTGSKKVTLKTKADKGLALELAELGAGFPTPLERAADALQRTSDKYGSTMELSNGDGTRVVTFEPRRSAKTTPTP